MKVLLPRNPSITSTMQATSVESSGSTLITRMATLRIPLHLVRWADLELASPT